MTLGSYIRSVLFDEVSYNEQNTHAQILAKLGQSDMAHSMRELSSAAKSGALLVTPETEAQLVQATRDIVEIKSLLMKALKIKED